MKIILAALVSVACTAIAQQIGGDYLGPGVLSSGAGNIGQRSGQPVDLRFFADVMGVYDNGIQPFAIDPKGQLFTVNGLYGEQVDAGIYGQHAWRQAMLGVDLHGNYYHYDNASRFDGGGGAATLGYSYQKSRHLIFTLRGTAGTSSLGYGSPGFYALSSDSAVVGQQSSILFDNRIYYLQGGASVVYVMTPRTSVILGGEGFTSQYSAAALVGVYGYNARATLQHRVSRTRTVGATYEHIHFSFVRSYGYSDTDIAQLFLANQLGRRWTFSLNAGVGRSQLQGVQQISLSPVVAALLGTSFGYQTFHADNYFPNGIARLTGKFHTSQVEFSYTKSITPGNGVYLTSRQDSAGIGYSYTGIHNWNFGFNGSYYHLSSFGQTTPSYNSFGGGAGLTYNLTHALHLVGRYDYRHQDIDGIDFRRNASRVTLGLAWSPGDHPLSLW